MMGRPVGAVPIDTEALGRRQRYVVFISHFRPSLVFHFPVAKHRPKWATNRSAERTPCPHLGQATYNFPVFRVSMLFSRHKKSAQIGAYRIRCQSSDNRALASPAQAQAARAYSLSFADSLGSRVFPTHGWQLAHQFSPTHSPAVDSRTSPR